MTERAGPVPTPGQWARVQLAQGESGAGLWDLSSEVPEARITVGSAQGAGWVVHAPDVAPVHFEFFWDGNSLWVSPPHDGELTVDGERIQAWRQLVGRSRVEFGRAAFLVETSQTIAMPPAGHAVGVVDDIPDRSTVPGAPRIPSASDFDDDPTAALTGRPDLDSVPPLESDATQMVDGAMFGEVAPPPASGGIGRPMLGAEALPPLTGTEQFGGELKTQILDTEAAGIDLRRSPLPPPPGPPPALSPGPELGRQRQIPTDVLPAQSPGSSVSETGSQFALPPIDDGAEQKQKLELPPRRTLILAGVTLLLAVIVLGSSIVRRNAREEAIEQATAEHASLDANATAEAIRARATEAAAQRAAAAQAREAALREDIQEPLDDARDAAESAAEEAVEAAGDDEPLDLAEETAKRLRFAVQKLAIDALARNEHQQGLAYYLWLAETYPDVEVYRSMVRVLREVNRREQAR